MLADDGTDVGVPGVLVALVIEDELPCFLSSVLLTQLDEFVCFKLVPFAAELAMAIAIGLEGTGEANKMKFKTPSRLDLLSVYPAGFKVSMLTERITC